MKNLKSLFAMLIIVSSLNTFAADAKFEDIGRSILAQFNMKLGKIDQKYFNGKTLNGLNCRVKVDNFTESYQDSTWRNSIVGVEIELPSQDLIFQLAMDSKINTYRYKKTAVGNELIVSVDNKFGRSNTLTKQALRISKSPKGQDAMIVSVEDRNGESYSCILK